MSDESAVVETDISTISSINRAEIDVQIATAHKFPRSIKRFKTEALDMVTLTEEIAEECIYALPRGGKTIEGPSARFAEVIASAWGNCRAGARVVAEERDFVVSQGIFHDLERNVAITYEVKRRIVDKYGKRYKPDMIAVTANAACSISLRNAILKGIPKAFWKEMYNAARKTVMGDAKTLVNRRAEALEFLQKLGATPEMVCKTLNVAGIEDIGLDELVVLRGLATAITGGDTTVEQAFTDKGGEDKGDEVTDRFTKPAGSAPDNERIDDQPLATKDTPTDSITGPQITKLNTCFSKLKIVGDKRLAWLKDNVKVMVTSTKDLSKAKACEAIDKLEMILGESKE